MRRFQFAQRQPSIQSLSWVNSTTQFSWKLKNMAIFVQRISFWITAKWFCSVYTSHRILQWSRPKPSWLETCSATYPRIFQLSLLAISISTSRRRKISDLSSSWRIFWNLISSRIQYIRPHWVARASTWYLRKTPRVFQLKPSSLTFRIIAPCSLCYIQWVAELHPKICNIITLLFRSNL